MRRAIAYALCLAGSVGYYFLMRFFAVGVGPDFGLGFVSGMMLLAILLWLAERAEKSSPTRRDGDL